jgi:hypothetical protein
VIPEVRYTGELQRVAMLPRRVWSPEDLALLVAELTSILRTPNGQMVLKPAQALALHDAGTEGGLFAPLGVGEGKTLATLLMPVVLYSERPLLLLPGGLVEKTRRDRLELSKHWRIPNTLRIASYDILGRVDAADMLSDYQPDAIICDEVHRLKNKRAAVTRRVARYMHDRPTTKFAGLTGTPGELQQFAHLLLWALKTKAPIPTDPSEIEEWAQVLDHDVDPQARYAPGALLSFCNAEDRAGLGVDTYTAVRRGFRRRLTETPGVVATVGEGEHVDCSIYVRGIRHKVLPITEANFRLLRERWRLPDEWPLMTAVDVWRHAQELALGLHYEWDERAPIEWMEARKAWHKFVRATINRGRTYDSELHVANGCDAGRLDATILNRWREIEPTFTPNTVPVWHDPSALEACRDWMKTPGIVWTEHHFFAERLAEFTGARYYGAGGFAADGKYIEDASPRDAVIASIDANREGKNLQELWSRCLFVCPPGNPNWIEQSIARIHRPKQKADEVIVDILLGCRENFDAIMHAIAAARSLADVTGKVQKLLLADVTLPTEGEIDALNTPRWRRDWPMEKACFDDC